MVRRRCGCAGDTCRCAAVSTESVLISGYGTGDSPLTLSRPFPLEVLNTPSLKMALAYGQENLLGIFPAGAANVQEFTANGTWMKPAGVSVARILLIGGGGGGASGSVRPGDPNAIMRGGGGGASGGATSLVLVGTQVPASAAVVVGVGGTGGAPVTGTANGANGGAGGDSVFNGVYRAKGGPGGRGDGSLVEAVIGGGTVVGDYGTPAAIPSDVVYDLYGYDYLRARNNLGPGGGAGGESYDPDEGQWYATLPGYSRAAMGSRYDSELGSNQDRDDLITKMGRGGHGGSASTQDDDTYDPSLTAGENGGLYGAGGGGGGAGLLNRASGAGGNGAQGIVVVAAW